MRILSVSLIILLLCLVNLNGLCLFDSTTIKEKERQIPTDIDLASVSFNRHNVFALPSISSLSINDCLEDTLIENTVFNDMWVTETIDSVGDVGFYSSISVLDDGRIVIIYYDRLNGDLKIAEKLQGSWTSKIIDSSGNVGLFASHAIDTNGIIHICYYDETNNDLKYAIQNDEGWDIQILEHEGDVGLYCSIDIDDKNDPHISFYDATEQVLKYTTRIDAEWYKEIVDTTLGAGHGSCLKIDKLGVIHISYSNGKDNYLYHATNRDDRWEVTCIDDTCSVVTSTSLALDSQGNPHICYYDIFSKNEKWSLNYATYVYGVWIMEKIDPDVQYFWNEWGCSIGIDRFDRVHVGYYQWKNWDLHYALKQNDEWVIESVESVGTVGAFASLALNSSGYPHISYMDLNNMALKHAVKQQFAPDKPFPPMGKQFGLKKDEHFFVVNTTDFDDDQVSYCIDWGDKTNLEWTPFYPSGVEIKKGHRWGSGGAYTIRVKAKDIYGFESPWSNPTTLFLPNQRYKAHTIINTYFMKQLEPFYKL
ncbi:MAG: hypothetical protein QCH96_05255 [Candidatus Thermoplasmatota archaeon]|nr:hypothetical protein [Candidatus Thermoplasmatota archaeon]